MTTYNALTRANEFRVLSAMQSNREFLCSKTRAEAAASLSESLGISVSDANVRGINKDAGLGMTFVLAHPRKPSSLQRQLFHWANPDGARRGIVPNSAVLVQHHAAIVKLAKLLDVPLKELGLDNLVAPSVPSDE